MFISLGFYQSQPCLEPTEVVQVMYIQDASWIHLFLLVGNPSIDPGHKGAIMSLSRLGPP